MKSDQMQIEPAARGVATSPADSPFHEGERRMQRRFGVESIEAWGRKVIRAHMPEQHRLFFTEQPFLIAAARDAEGRPWATVLDAMDRFVTSPDPQHLRLASRPRPGDPLAGAFEAGADLGLLGIELKTRRRNRVNGRIAATGDGGFTFRVDQSFGNCPQYIRERAWRRAAASPASEARWGDRLTARQSAWIAAADTLFIASGHRGAGERRSYGMDASHRGGESGFVEVLDETRIRFPDYAGNRYYNTLGNILLDPRVGLLFVDFETGSLLHLTGRASVGWEPDALARFPGAMSLVTLQIEAVVERRAATWLRWQKAADSVRSLRLVEKSEESADVVSLHFEARDGGGLPLFEPGQHLQLELEIPPMPAPVRRSYSLSAAPDGRRYRISVKREAAGLASRFLHDRLPVGAVVQSRRPAGDFTAAGHGEPGVLISAGIGVTPMVSMLAAAVERRRPLWFIHGARDGAHHPFAAEIRALVAKHGNAGLHIAYSRPRDVDVAGRDYDSQGRVDADLVMRLVGDRTARFYLCGPAGFMAQLQDGLERLGVPGERIHAETFGPSSQPG